MENILLNSMEISQEVKDKFDAVAKSVFSLKEIIADLLIHVMPEIFGNMDREEIVRECLTDSDNPDSIYITKLEPHYMKNTKHEHLYDIVFKVKLPQRWLSKKKRDSRKEFYLQNIEPQSSHGNSYSEEMRVVIYLSHLFLNENEYFQITESTKEEYKKALPVCSVWIMYEPSKVDRYSTHRYILIKEKEVNGYYIPVTNEDEFPVLSAYIINLGPDNHLKRNDIYGKLRTLLTEDSQTVSDLIEQQEYHIPERERIKMTFGEARLHSAYLLGEQKGIAQGIEKGIAQGIEKGIEKGKLEERRKILEEKRKLREMIQNMNKESLRPEEIMALLDVIEENA